MTTLILVRHAESAANGNGVFAGHLDIPLSERGILQAQLTAQYIARTFRVDALYSSDLQRAWHTAQPIARQCAVEATSTDQLREICAGQWQGKSFDHLQQHYANSYGVWLRDIGRAHPEGGESVVRLADRIWEQVQQIVRTEQGRTVVIVTHATPIRTLMCRWMGMETERLKEVGWVSNASVSVIRVEGDCWTMEQVGADEHLSELRTVFPANV